MSFQSLGKKGHDNFRHLEKNVTITFVFRPRISRLSAHEIINYVSSFYRYIQNVMSIGKISRTEESLNTRLSNVVKFDCNIFLKHSNAITPFRPATLKS